MGVFSQFIWNEEDLPASFWQGVTVAQAKALAQNTAMLPYLGVADMSVLSQPAAATLQTNGNGGLASLGTLSGNVDVRQVLQIVAMTPAQVGL